MEAEITREDKLLACMQECVREEELRLELLGWLEKVIKKHDGKVFDVRVKNDIKDFVFLDMEDSEGNPCKLTVDTDMNNYVLMDSNVLRITTPSDRTQAIKNHGIARIVFNLNQIITTEAGKKPRINYDADSFKELRESLNKSRMQTIADMSTIVDKIDNLLQALSEVKQHANKLRNSISVNTYNSLYESGYYRSLQQAMSIRDF